MNSLSEALQASSWVRGLSEEEIARAGAGMFERKVRVARCLAWLFNPLLYPGTGAQLQISQEEIGFLSGVSRQRVNQALRRLDLAQLLEVEYGGITVLDLNGLHDVIA